jgi:hypothetical protein
MIVGLVIYQFEPENKKRNSLRENWSKDSFENTIFFSFSFPGAARSGTSVQIPEI